MTIFTIISLVAISCGGLLVAFTARQPTQLKSWLSAYLVLVVGLLQLGIVACCQSLGMAAAGLTLLALILFNLGNALVIIGRIIKSRSRWSLRLVAFGAALLIVSSLRIFLSSIGQGNTAGTKIWLTMLLAIVIISAIAGTTMSAKKYVK